MVSDCFSLDCGPIAVFLLVLNLDIFGGLFVSVFVQVILLGAGLGILG